MKWSTKPLPDALEGLVLADHADHGFVLCKWHGARQLPGYDAVGFRNVEHHGQSHPLTALQVVHGDRVNRWAVVS